jgi:hypothetical protein
MKNNALILEGPKLGFSGTVQSWEVINKDGSIARACYKPYSNLITNYGLSTSLPYGNYSPWGSNLYLWRITNYIAIGTGESEPTITDTRLGTEVFRGERMYTAYNAEAVTPPGGVDGQYYATKTIGYQTNLGDLNHDITEIGFSHNSGFNSESLFSKHRLKDEFGNPTSVRVNSNQQIRLKYILSIFATPLDTYTGSFALAGYSPETINYTAKWQEIKSVEEFGRILASFLYCSQIDLRRNVWTFQPIGTTISNSGDRSTCRSSDFAVSSDGLGGYYAIRNYYIGTDAATWADGTKSFGLFSDSHDSDTHLFWAANLDTPILKPNTHRMSFRVKLSWGRTT